MKKKLRAIWRLLLTKKGWMVYTVDDSKIELCDMPVGDMVSSMEYIGCQAENVLRDHDADEALQQVKNILTGV